MMKDIFGFILCVIGGVFSIISAILLVLFVACIILGAIILSIPFLVLLFGLNLLK